MVPYIYRHIVIFDSESINLCMHKKSQSSKSFCLAFDFHACFFVSKHCLKQKPWFFLYPYSGARCFALRFAEELKQRACDFFLRIYKKKLQYKEAWHVVFDVLYSSFKRVVLLYMSVCIFKIVRSKRTKHFQGKGNYILHKCAVVL